MTDATYRIISAKSGITVEIIRPGKMTTIADGFASEADAQSWIRQDKHIAEIDDRREPIAPPHLRLV